MVTQRGIEANPHATQSYNGLLGSYFQERSTTTDWLPGSPRAVHIPFHRSHKAIFLITLKGAKRAGLNEECNKAFMAIKQYLTEPPILASPRVGDTLYLYLVVSKVSVSADLFKEDENQKQRPIFFISKSLAEIETRYTRLEQATLAFHMVVKKLCPYF